MNESENFIVIEDDLQETAYNTNDQDTDTGAIERDHDIQSESTEKRIPIPENYDLKIYDGGEISLSLIDIEAVHAADNAIKKGKIPVTMGQGRESIFSLGNRNGMYFYIIVGQCLIIPILIFFILETVMGLPVIAKPSTETIDNYSHVKMEAIHAITFAHFIIPKFDSWNHWNIDKKTESILPFLDPTIHGQYESKRRKMASTAKTYKERQVAEIIKVEYGGVIQETLHKVIVYYQIMEGRGLENELFQVDGFSRRVKILQISETVKTAKNKFGLTVVKHSDLTERTFRGRFNTSPWDTEEGRKTKRTGKRK